MITKDQLKAVILECGTFFQAEIEHRSYDFMTKVMGERLERNFRELSDKCWGILGNPSIAEAERILASAAEEEES